MHPKATSPAVSEGAGDRPAVAHVMRIYLRRTETFVGNQIGTLRRYSPLVLCYRRQPDLDCGVADVGVESDLLQGFWKHLDRLSYGLARYTFPESVASLARYALDRKATLLHYHFLVDARFLLEVKRQTRLPAIASAYGYDVSSFPRSFGGMGLRYLRPLFKEIDYFVAMSRDMRNDLLALGCPQEKILVHYYGTDTGRFSFPGRTYDERDTVTILVCGALRPKKAQHLVLQALRLVEQEQMTTRQFRIVLVGDGPSRAGLERQAAGYGWQNRVLFAGHVPHQDVRLVQYYRDADVFTLPSTTTLDGEKEGIPGTIVEAMASGLPVVSTMHGGIPEIIESGKEGILVREGDVRALAEAYAALVNSAPLRQELGTQAAWRATTSLDLQQGTNELEMIYTSILNQESPAASFRRSENPR